MDDAGNLALQYEDTSYTPPAPAERELLPPPSPIVMPRQSLDEGELSSRPLSTSPANIGLRRLVLFGATLALAALAAWTPFKLYAREGFMPFEVVGLTTFSVLILAISCWFCSALIGLVVLLRRGDSDELDFPRALSRPTTRTALLMPLYNEDAYASMSRLAAIERSLSKLGVSQWFDLFVLSDTTREPVAVSEWAAFTSFRMHSKCRAFYRRRKENTERKAGNIGEWVRRFGGAYENMIILDADSTMSGETILRLVGAMEQHPDIGLIQTTPRIVEASSLFARASQFGVRLYGRVASAGLAWWAGSEASYWGHNAIVRVRAFAQCSGLPELEGRKPFGGHILSHDVVEAALLRRGGWGVHVTPALGGSYEETPPNLVEFMKRERRWCQGNMQHLALIGAPGLHWMSRFQLIVGCMAYLASPVWLTSLVIGLLIQAGNEPDPNWFSLWSFLHPDMGPLFWASMLTLVMLIGPKMMGFALVMLRPAERAAFGGGKQLIKGMAVEMALSAATAPIYMIGNTRAVFEILTGKDAGWTAQVRDSNGLHKDDARRYYRNEMFAGLFFAIALAPRPDLLLWVWPIVLPLLLAGPIAAWTSRTDLGARARAAGLMVTPEERGLARALKPVEIARPAVVRLTPATAEADAARVLEVA